MLESKFSDVALVEDSAEYLQLSANHSKICCALERMEMDFVTEQEVDAIRRRLMTSARRMHAVLLRIGRRDAQTKAGVLAKFLTLRSYSNQYLAEDVGVITLLHSLAGDVERLVGTPDR